MLDRKTKEKIIEKYRTHESDTGSAQVQVALLTVEINELANHLKVHKKDFSSRRGLLKKISERRKKIMILKKENEKVYKQLVKELGIK